MREKTVSKRPPPRAGYWLLAAVMAGCSGSIDGAANGGDGTSEMPSDGQPGPGKRPPGSPSGGGAGSGGAMTTPPVPGASASTTGPLPMRRLTQREYDNTIADLLGDTTGAAKAFPPDALNDAGFATPQAVSTLEARAYMDAAEAIANRAIRDVQKILPCDAKADEAGCARLFVERFGRRAYRRPLTTAERDDLVAIYDGARKEGIDFANGIGLVLQAFLQSPKFLYRWEVAPGAKPVVQNGIARLTPHQLASRLSYTLWGRPPDDQLLDAADAGKLVTTDDVLAQARRLFAVRERAADGVTDFHRQWLHLEGVDGLDAVTKSASVYPKWNDAMRAGMSDGLDAFVSQAWLDPASDRKVKTLLTSNTAFVNEATAPLYGLTDVKGTALVARPVDATRRAGLFTQAAFLARHATPSGSHPTKRGTILWRDAVCGPLGQVPADVPMPPAAKVDVSTRERFAAHDKEPCAVCHVFLDPLGFALESFDGVGAYRDTDGGKPVDASGQVTLPSGTKLTFKNAVEMLNGLAASPDAGECLSRKLTRYALGRSETDEDEGAIRTARDTLARTGDLRELAFAAVTSPSFLTRTLEEGETR